MAAGRGTYLSVRNFHRYQHYKKRNPPWLKLYRSILDDHALSTLPEATRWLAIGLVLLASTTENRIVNDPEWIKNRLNLRDLPDLQSLRRIGFITGVSASTMLDERKQNHLSETETETETEKSPLSASQTSPLGGPVRERRSGERTLPGLQIPDPAEAEVQAFVALVGHRPTAGAVRAAQRLAKGGLLPALERARQRYAAEVEQRDTPREYRIRPHTWFGREERWKQYDGEAPVLEKKPSPGAAKGDEAFFERFPRW